MLLSDWRKQNSPLHCRAGLSFSTSGASLTNYSFIPFIPVQPKHHCSSKSSREKTQQVLRLLSGFNCSCCLTEQGVCHITRVTMMRNQRQLGKYPGAVVVEEVCYSCVLFQKGSQTHLPPNDSFCWTGRAQTALVSQHREEPQTSLLSSKTPQVWRELTIQGHTLRH